MSAGPWPPANGTAMSPAGAKRPAAPWRRGCPRMWRAAAASGSLPSPSEPARRLLAASVSVMVILREIRKSCRNWRRLTMSVSMSFVRRLRPMRRDRSLSLNGLRSGCSSRPGSSVRSWSASVWKRRYARAMRSSATCLTTCKTAFSSTTWRSTSGR